MLQDRMIELTTQKLSQAPGVRALFLAGSRGAGTEDRYSDIDFLVIVEDGAAEAAESVGTLWVEAMAGIEPLVLSRRRPAGWPLVNIITESWVRADLHVAGTAALDRRGQDMLRPLHDPGDLHSTLPPEAPRRDPAASLPYLIEEFLRVLGLLPVALGRAQYQVSITGLGLLRGLLIDLMLAENGPKRATGMFTLDTGLTEEQRLVLETLPQAAPARESLLAANMVMAQIFLPRARRLAAHAGIPWPEAFEAATRAHLRVELGVDYASGSADPPFRT